MARRWRDVRPHKIPSWEKQVRVSASEHPCLLPGGPDFNKTHSLSQKPLPHLVGSRNGVLHIPIFEHGVVPPHYWGAWHWNAATGGSAPCPPHRLDYKASPDLRVVLHVDEPPLPPPSSQAIVKNHGEAATPLHLALLWLCRPRRLPIRVCTLPTAGPSLAGELTVGRYDGVYFNGVSTLGKAADVPRRDVDLLLTVTRCIRRALRRAECRRGVGNTPGDVVRHDLHDQCRRALRLPKRCAPK